MQDENLKKLLEAIKKDPELKELGEIDEDTLDILNKMSQGKVDVDEASEILLAKKNYNSVK